MCCVYQWKRERGSERKIERERREGGREGEEERVKEREGGEGGRERENGCVAGGTGRVGAGAG